MVRRRTCLSVHPLEVRDTPAGGVTASVTAGVLTVTGDDYGNVLVIQRRADSFSIDGTDTLINGSTDPFVAGELVHTIKVYANGGADHVSIAPDVDFIQTGPALFDLGDGNNTLKLVTTGELSMGALTVKGGDGLDSVQVDAAPGSQVGPMFVTYGIGGSNTTLKHLTVGGVGTVVLAGADGGDTLTLDDCQTKTVTFSGGYGQGNLIIKNSTVGSVTLNGSQGPANLSLTNTTVNGSVKAVGPEGIQVSLNGVTVNGGLTATGGLFDLDSKVGLTVGGANTVAGDVTAKGYTTNVTLQNGSSLSATGNIALHATDALTGGGTGVDVSAKDFKLTSPRAASFVVDGAGSSLTLTGALTATGRTVEVKVPQVTVPQSVIVQGSAKAELWAAGTFGQNVTVTSSLGSAKLQLGGQVATDVVGNVYVSGKLTTGVGLAGTYHGFVTVNGGTKADSFGTGAGTFEKNVTVQLKDGDNVVGISAFGPWDPPEIKGNLKVTTGNGADLIGFRCHVFGTTTVLTGGGADTVQAYQSTFDGATVISTGGGDDTLILMDAPFFDIPLTFNAKATIDAGAGNDTLILGKAPGDPNLGEGDANSKVVFAPGTGSSVSGGTGINTFDDEAGQFAGVALGTDITGWTDPT